jgi:hypothetical protein
LTKRKFSLAFVSKNHLNASSQYRQIEISNNPVRDSFEESLKYANKRLNSAQIKTISYKNSKYKGFIMNSTAELNVIAALNLDPIKVKLMHKESGEGWSRVQVNEVEIEYRRFLHLLKLFPDEQVTPRFDVDIFWHYHILDTMKYAVDCEKVFGYFLHHYPYSGLGGEDDEADHHRTGARTQELYEVTFGETWIRQEEAYAIAEFSEAIAQNDRTYSLRPVAGSSKMAVCDGIARNDASLVRPVSGSSKMAFCDGVAQNDRTYSVRPVSGPSKMAFCDGVAQNHGAYSARPVSGSSKMAFCDGVAQNDASLVRPVSGSSKMAFCDGVAQNDNVYLVRPMSAIAA